MFRGGKGREGGGGVGVSGPAVQGQVSTQGHELGAGAFEVTIRRVRIGFGHPGPTLGLAELGLDALCAVVCAAVDRRSTFCSPTRGGESHDPSRSRC